MGLMRRGVAADVRTVRTLLGAARNRPEPVRQEAVRRAAGALSRCGRDAGRPAWSSLAERLLGASGPRLAALLDSALAELASNDDEDGQVDGEVLVVEGEPAPAALLGLALDEPGRSLRFAPGVDAAREALDAGAFDVVVASVGQPDGDARELLAWMRASPRHELTPVVLCGVEPGDVAECHAFGADVVLADPTPPEALAASVRHLVRRARRERALRQVDGSTGLPNEAGLRAAFERARAACARRHRPSTIARVVFPADGDLEAQARLVARRAEHALRRADVVGRVGPSEFVVLMPETDTTSAQRATGRLAAQVDVDGLVTRVEPVRPTDTWADALSRVRRGAAG